MSTDKLAKGWRRVKFGDVVRKVSDRVDPDTATIERYVAGEHMGSDDLTIRRWGQVGDGYLGPAFHMRFKPGQVLYGSRRTYLRKVAVADFEGITANTTFVLEPSSKDLLPEFLPLVMTTEVFHEHSIKQSKGSVNPYINFSDLTWYEFALPPVNEQRRLVEILHVAEEARLRSAIARQAIDTLIESFAQEAVRGAEGASLMLGEIVARADDPTAFIGYWQDAEKTAAMRLGPWLRTGDYGTCDEDGYFWYHGRNDDLIKSSGYRIGPAEVEDALIRHPAVAEAAVVGAPDPERGQIVVAFVRLAPGRSASDALAGELQRHVKDRLAVYKYPRVIRFVDDFPLTSTGKISRKTLRLGLEAQGT